MTRTLHITTSRGNIAVHLRPTERLALSSWIDCNMATAWVGDRYRIFPGKYGEDPVWGDSDDLRFADGVTVEETYTRPSAEFRAPQLPPIAAPGAPGLHGAIWFETVYQDPTDASGATLAALYHNENYPSTLPLDSATGVGLSDREWPPGLQGDDSIQAVPRIGIMRSIDGGESWVDRGILLEDRDDRMIRLPTNRNYCFPGGVGDPSAVASGEYLYVFYGEYAYPGPWSESTWNSRVEASGQCVSVARVPLSALDAPTGAAQRWGGSAFDAPWDGVGAPIRSLQIAEAEGGGAVSQGDERYYWGPSVSWNEHLECWVMLLGRVDGAFWVGDSVFLSLNPNKDLGEGDASQQWTTPQLLLHRPGHTLWYPALQPTDSPEDLAARRSSARLGQRARLFVKDMVPGDESYASDLTLEFEYV